MDIAKTDQGNGLSLWTFEDGTVQIRCNDCNQWIHATANTSTIRHSKRCSTPATQPSRATRQPRTADGLSNTEALQAVQRGYLSPNQAMNRDF